MSLRPPLRIGLVVGLLLLSAAGILRVTGILPLEAAEPTVAYRSLGDWQSASREELKTRFDEVARNLGAFESAYYTYTLEFAEVPPTAQAMIDAGHLRVPMINPYTGTPLIFPHGEDLSSQIRIGTALAGDIWFLPDAAGGEVSMAGMYLDPNDPARTKWMRRDIIKYVRPAEAQVVFDPRDSREVQLTRVVMSQLTTAIDDYVIRFGKTPRRIADLKDGDVLVNYSNPFAPHRVVRESAKLSPGNLHYIRIDDDTYDLIGWGDTGPVYYYSEAPYHWSVTFNEKSQTVAVVVITEEDIEGVRSAGPGEFTAEPGELLNQLILVDTKEILLTQERIAAWQLAHPDCLECGSAKVYWEHTGLEAGDPKVCKDAESGVKLPDCCCQDADSHHLQPM